METTQDEPNEPEITNRKEQHRVGLLNDAQEKHAVILCHFTQSSANRVIMFQLRLLFYQKKTSFLRRRRLRTSGKLSNGSKVGRPCNVSRRFAECFQSLFI